MSMLLLEAQDLLKTYGDRTVLEIGRLEIREGDRIGLVGANGAGKSTLLHLLYGDLPADRGTVQRRCGIALVRQSGEAEGRGDRRLLKELRLTGSAVKSGGERTRLALAAAFSQNAPLLFADEPTTNLDLDGIERFQKLLADFRGAVLLVSHDRALLERSCTQIWELENGGLRAFPGSYTAWVAEKDRERQFQQFEYERYRAERARLTAGGRALREHARAMRKAPRRMGPSEARLHKGDAAALQGQAAHRAAVLLRRAEQLEAKERPSDLPQVRMALGAARPIVSRTAVRVEGLTVRYGGRAVLDGASLTLPTGSRTVLLGPNGAGKTTAVERIVGGDPAVRLADGVRIGYFSQTHDLLDPGRTVLENARKDSSLPESEVRTILANLLLAGDSVHKKAEVLSGGERAKTAFARLLCSDCNLLVLDEPTNHIDLYAAEALEALLCRWEGTLLVVTHDRRLAERVATRLCFLEDGRVRSFEGGWDAWQAERARLSAPRDAGLSELIDQLRRARGDL